MSNIIGQAQIIISANIARFQSELRNAQDSARSTFRNIYDNALEMNAKLELATKGITAVVSTASNAMQALIGDQIELAKELNQVALRANTTASSIQKYVVAAKTVGIETDKMGDIFKDTQDKIGDFLSTGGGEMQDFFENVAPQIGVTAEQFRQLSGPDALQLYYDSLEKANLSQSEMVFYMESVADEASALIPLLADGGKGFKLWEQAAANAGATMDQKTVRATQELQTSTDLLKLSYQGIKNQIAQQLIPVVSSLATVMVKDAGAKNAAAAAGRTLAFTLKTIVSAGMATVGIFRIMGESLGALAYAFAHPTQAWDTMKASWENIKGIFNSINKDIDIIWDERQGANPLVTQLDDIRAAAEKAHASLGKTGAQIQDEQKKAEEAEKARQKATKNALNMGDYQLAVYSAWKKAGLSDQQAKIMTAEVGRENAYNPNTLFGYHVDHNNGQINAGMISWQKDRATNLKNYLTSQGLLKGGKIERSQASLDAMARFAVNEILTNPRYARTKNQFLANPNIDTQTAFQITGRNYIAWDMDGRKIDAKKHAARRDAYYRQISAKAGLVDSGGSVHAFWQDLKTQEDAAKRAEQEAQRRAEARLRLEREYADKLTQLKMDYEAKVQEILNAGFDPVKQKQMLDKAQAQYSDDVRVFALAQQQKVAELENFRKTEREIIEQEYSDARRKIMFDQDMNQAQKDAAIAAISAQRDLRLSNIQLEEDKERQAANSVHQTRVENIQAEAELKRRDLLLDMRLDAQIRRERLDAINQIEQEALEVAQRDFERELADINADTLTAIDQIHAEYQRKRDELDHRTDIDDAQKSDLRNAMAGAEIRAIRRTREVFEVELSGITDYSRTELERLDEQFRRLQASTENRTDINTPDKLRLSEAQRAKYEYDKRELQQSAADAYNALNAEMSGTADLYNLQTQLDARLEIIKKAEEVELLTIEQAEQAKLAVRREYMQSSSDLITAQAEQTASSLSTMVKTIAGENSKAYRAMFAIEKGFAIARSIMAIQTGIAQASAMPFPMNLGAMASVAAATANIITNLQAVRMPTGQAHDGIDYVPKEGTWILDKGERVVRPSDNRKLTDFLDNPNKNNPAPTVNIHNYSGQPIAQRQTSNGDLELIIGEQIAKQLPQHVDNPYSDFNKSLKQNYQLQRRV